MAGKEKDANAAPGDGDKDKAAAKGDAPASRRPPHTIDLKAEEVETKTGEEGEKPAAKEAEAVEDKSAQPASEKPGPQAKEPPQRTRPGEIKGFVTHLAAGLVGGAVGVVGLGYGMGSIAPDLLRGGAQVPALEQALDEAGKKIAALETGLASVGERPMPGEKRIDALEQEITALKERPVPKDEALAEAMKALEARLAQAEEALKAGAAIEARLAKAEQALGAQMGATGEARERLAAAEKALGGLWETLNTLRASAAEGGDVAQTAAIAARINELAARLDARVAAVEQRPLPEQGVRQDLNVLRTNLENRMAVLEQAPPDARIMQQLAGLGRELGLLRQKMASSTGLPADLSARLEQIEAALGKVSAEAAKKRSADTVALALAFASLARAVDAGRPFAGELEALKALLPEGLDDASLEPHAEKGAPAPLALRRLFERHRQSAAKAVSAPEPERAEEDTTLVGQLLGNARSVIQIRRVGTAQDSESGKVEGVLADMAARLDEGDIAGALALAEKLPDSARKALQPWAGMARARIDLDAALGRLSERMAARLAGGDAAQSR
jgi:hypothetical protein